jgi:hypothetical protein
MNNQEAAHDEDPNFHKLDLRRINIPGLDSLHIPRTWKGLGEVLVGGEIVDNVRRVSVSAPLAALSAVASLEGAYYVFVAATATNIVMAASRIMEPSMTKSEGDRQKKRLEKIDKLKTRLATMIQPRAQTLFEKSMKNKKMTIESDRIYSGKPIGAEKISEVNLHFIPQSSDENDSVLLEFRPLLEPDEVDDTPFGESWVVGFERIRENGDIKLTSSGGMIDSNELLWDWSKELGQIGRLKWITKMLANPNINLDPEVVIYE